MISPEADAEFAANVEDVMEIYAKSYHPQIPVLCMNEQPVQLVKEVKRPIAATKVRSKRVDYEYERAGVASVFMFAGPLSRWRAAAIRASKTKADWPSRWRGSPPLWDVPALAEYGVSRRPREVSPPPRSICDLSSAKAGASRPQGLWDRL